MPKTVNKIKVNHRVKFKNTKRDFIDQDFGLKWWEFFYAFPETEFIFEANDFRTDLVAQVTVYASKDFGNPILIKNDSKELFAFAFLNPLYNSAKDYTDESKMYWVHYLGARTKLHTIPLELLEHQFNLDDEDFIPWVAQMTGVQINRRNYRKEVTKIATLIKTRLFSECFKKEGGAPVDRKTLASKLSGILPPWTTVNGQTTTTVVEE